MAGIMWAYVIGGLVGVAAGMGVRAEVFRARIDQANDLISDFEDPTFDDGDEDEQEVASQSRQVARQIRRYIHKQYTMSKSDACVNDLVEFYPVFDTLTPNLQRASSVLIANQYLKSVPYLSLRYMTTAEQAIIALKVKLLEFASGELIDIENATDGLGRGIFIFKSGCAFNFDMIEHSRMERKLEDMQLITAGMCKTLFVLCGASYSFEAYRSNLLTRFVSPNSCPSKLTVPTRCCWRMATPVRKENSSSLPIRKSFLFLGT